MVFWKATNTTKAGMFLEDEGILQPEDESQLPKQDRSKVEGFQVIICDSIKSKGLCDQVYTKKQNGHQKRHREHLKRKQTLIQLTGYCCIELHNNGFSVCFQFPFVFILVKRNNMKSWHASNSSSEETVFQKWRPELQLHVQHEHLSATRHYQRFSHVKDATRNTKVRKLGFDLRAVLLGCQII